MFNLSPNISYAANESGTLSSTWDTLTNSEKLLVVKYPVAALIVHSAQKETDEFLTSKYGYNRHIDGAQSNAYRHSLWNAIMTSDLNNRALAESFATAHEDYPDTTLLNQIWMGHNGLAHKSMDLLNNQIGRDCVYWYELYPSSTILSTRVISKLTNNQMKLLVYYPGYYLQIGSNNKFVMMVQERLNKLVFWEMKF